MQLNVTNIRKPIKQQQQQKGQDDMYKQDMMPDIACIGWQTITLIIIVYNVLCIYWLLTMSET